MEHYGFRLLKEFDISELNTHGRLFEHVITGARLLSMENKDENKVFGITFRTPPPDSTGLPHIMEHSVLCGSRKYPVKEPFVELMKGSLNTFLNAMTFPDKTCYPVASQNTQDLYNLMDVYLDAVFYPLIPSQTLQQEGWHYELESLDSPLTYKGVVFNEMKGAYSSPDSLLAKHTQETLFPDHVYGLDSGGDPQVMPLLTYEQFKRYHATYYHPSNAYIYFYGDDDPMERLRRVNEYLKDFRRIEVGSEIPLMPSFEQPRAFEFGFDPGDDESAAQKAMFVVNWVLDNIHDPKVNLALGILAHILIGTPASPLRKALIDSGLGDDLAGLGLESDIRQMIFSTGLKGITVENAAKVEALIDSTLRSLVQEGIDPDMVAAALNTIEFRLRENNTGSFPQGLLLMLRALQTWLYDDDPVKGMAFEAPLSALKAQLSNQPNYFESLIQKYLLDNPHRTKILLRPQTGLNQEKDALERERLANIKSGMSREELERIQVEAEALQKRQETPDTSEALATIPSLKLSDIDKENKTIPIEVTSIGESTLLYHDLFTNGIVYLDLGFDLHYLPQEYLPYVTLFGRALLEMGTEKEDFVKLSQRIGRTTGGIRTDSFISSARGQSQAVSRLFLRGKATMAQSQELLSVLKDVLLTVKLDNSERFRQMVLEEKADQESGLVPGGHRVVNTRLRAQFNEAGWVSEQIGGISYLFFLRQLAEQVEKDWSSVLEKLEQIRQYLLHTSGIVCNVTLDKKNWMQFQPHLQSLLSVLPVKEISKSEWKVEPPPAYEGLTIPAQVNYVGKGVNLYESGYTLHGSIYVILNYLQATWLWERVRVQGGAYGGFSVFDPRSGVLTFLSYRDPNLLATLTNYDGSIEFLKHLDSTRLNSNELTKSIIGAIGDMDAYQLPDAKGYTSMLRYLLSESDEYRQQVRNEILSTTLQDFCLLGEILAKVVPQGRVTVLGSSEAIENANKERSNWLQVVKVL